MKLVIGYFQYHLICLNFYLDSKKIKQIAKVYVIRNNHLKTEVNRYNQIFLGHPEVYVLLTWAINGKLVKIFSLFPLDFWGEETVLLPPHLPYIQETCTEMGNKLLYATFTSVVTQFRLYCELFEALILQIVSRSCYQRESHCFTGSSRSSWLVHVSLSLAWCVITQWCWWLLLFTNKKS